MTNKLIKKSNFIDKYDLYKIFDSDKDYCSISNVFKTIRYKYKMLEDESGVEFKIEAPGYERDQIKVELNKNREEFKVSIGDESKIFSVLEMDTDNMKAELKNGMLTVTVPFKKEDIKTIEIL